MDVHKLNQPVYIVPFSARGVLFYHLLRKCNIPVAGFLDNNSDLQGDCYDGCEILSPQQIQSIIGSATIVVCTSRYADVISRQFHDLGASTVCMMSDFSADVSTAGLTEQINTTAFSAISPSGVPTMRELILDCQKIDRWQDILMYLINFDGSPYSFVEQPIRTVNTTQKTKFILCVNGTSDFNDAYFDTCMKSIMGQLNAGFDPVFFFCKDNLSIVEQWLEEKELSIGTQVVVTERPIVDAFDLLEYAKPYASRYDYIVVMNAHDVLSHNAVCAISEASAKHSEYSLITAYEDRVYKDSYIAPFYKDDYIKDDNTTLKGLVRNFFAIHIRALDRLYSLQKSDVFIIKEVLYHYRVDEIVKHDNGIKPIAFYLPQFHPIPENNKWWGEGFTEWVNVKRSFPMFSGHYQPHEPGVLGYYDLVDDDDVQRKQIELAKQYGIYGFCYYYYWFNGKRLLEKPLDRILGDKTLDFPFCICWANETWSRRWDGSESEVLMQQVHNSETDKKFILDIIPILKDPRYITINGAPLLLIYRVDLFEDIENTIKGWRKICAEHGLPHIHVSMVQAFNAHNPLIRGCDSATEFPPHKGKSHATTDGIEGLDPEFSGHIYDYREFAARAMNIRRTDFLNFRGVMPSWDNTARRLTRSEIFRNAEPEEYKKLLLSIVDFTSRIPKDQRLIFINAWNEWAEGAHLEPDKKHGNDYLKATLDAIHMNC